MVQNDRSESPPDARQRIVQAALKALIEEGYAGTSARAIARCGGFAASAIYYHFQDLDSLLLAALDHSSRVRLARYRAVLDGVSSAAHLLERLRELYMEDREHIAAVRQLVTGAPARMGPAILELLEPWLAFTAEIAGRFLAGWPIAPRDVALTVLATYMGLETLSHLDGDRSRVEGLFDAARPLAAVYDQGVLP